jgi:hypothetical protein
MYMHGRVQGVRVEANVVLELEEGRWTVGRTGELRLEATADAVGRLSCARVNAREEGVRGARRRLGRLA